MKTTIKQIQDAVPALQILTGCKLPVKAAYSVSKLVKACDRELAEFNEARVKIFTEGGCVVVDGNYANPPDKEVLKDCLDKAEELRDTEVEINALPLDIEQFGNGDVPGAAFLGLDWAMKQEA